MPGLRAQELAFSCGDALHLQDITFHLGPGWTGLVGANGAGKTTLLRLLAGELTCSSGQVVRDPGDMTVLLCPQAVEQRGPEIEVFAEDPSGARLRGQLELDPADLRRWPTLSPGERKRWQIGAALFAEPELLLLDEPTNHLDAAAQALVLAALRRFRGIGVVVSHDRALLEALTSRTLRVDRGTATLWPGAYAAARAAWEHAREFRNGRHEVLQADHRALTQRLGDARRAHAASDARRSSSKRMKNLHDQDATCMGAKYRTEQAEIRTGRSVHVLRDSVNRSAQALAASAYESERGAAIAVSGARAPMAYVLTIDAPSLYAGPRRLLGPVRLALGREDRVHLSGANGAGKTTLLNAMLAASRCPPERLLWVPQELSQAECAALVEELRRCDADERGQVLARVSALGVDPTALLASSSPSPGECRKLLLAQGLARGVWALVLDEPTNHLDLPSIERIEAALAEYRGALLLVSHDHALASRLTTRTWRLAHGEVQVMDRGFN